MSRVLPTLEAEAVRLLVLSKQHLLARLEPDEWRRVPRSLAGVHAARFKSPVHSLAARVDLRSKGEIARKLYGAQDLIKIRCMRGTLHIVPLDQAHIFHSATWRQRRAVCERLIRGSGSAAQEAHKVFDTLKDLLEGQQLTPVEIEERAAANGFLDKPLVRSALKLLWERGDLCYINQSTRWALEERRYGTTHERHGQDSLRIICEAEAEIGLLRTYFDAYGPATVADAAWWSGLSRGRVERAVNTMRDVKEVRVSGENGPHLVSLADLKRIEANERFDNPEVRLLAYEDNLLKGYMPSRVRFVDQNYFPRVFNAIGEARATVMSSGVVVGIWTWNARADRPEVELFRKLRPSERALLTDEIERLSLLARASN